MTIEIYGGPSPNVIKVLVACEELGLAYTRTPLDILKGEQFTPEFLAISPNNRIPAIVDHDPRDGGGPLSVFESGAILSISPSARVPCCRPKRVSARWSCNG